jgi:hypothetical protein
MRAMRGIRSRPGPPAQFCTHRGPAAPSPLGPKQRHHAVDAARDAAADAAAYAAGAVRHTQHVRGTCGTWAQQRITHMQQKHCHAGPPKHAHVAQTKGSSKCEPISAAPQRATKQPHKATQ